MHIGHKKLGYYSNLCEKDACKVLRHYSIFKWAIGATIVYLAKHTPTVKCIATPKLPAGET
jgi:hypothetical protein